MRTITVDEAQSELPQVLDEVEAGAEVIIARGEKRLLDWCASRIRRDGGQRWDSFAALRFRSRCGDCTAHSD